MSARWGAAIAAVVAAMALAGCAGGDEQADPAAGVASTSVAPTAEPGQAHMAPGMDGTPLPEPTPVPGTDQGAIESAAEKFALNWACYRTFAQQPQKEWFDSWSNLATDEFVQRQRVAFVDTWSWAWNTETQVIGCQREGPVRFADTGDNSAAVRITVQRHLYHADARADGGQIESQTYDVAVQTADGRIPTIAGAAQVADDAPFPPRTHILGR